MTSRTEIEMGCTLSSCSMFMVYYYSDWLYIIEILAYFNASRDKKKFLESCLSWKIENSCDTKTSILSFLYLQKKVEQSQMKISYRILLTTIARTESRKLTRGM